MEEMKKITNLDPNVLDDWMKNSPAWKVYKELKMLAEAEWVDIQPRLDNRGHLGSQFYYDGKLIGFGTRIGGREVGDYDWWIVEYSVKLEDLIKVPQLKMAIAKTWKNYSVNNIVHLEYCLQGILWSEVKFSPVDLMLEMWLKDMEKIRDILLGIVKDLKVYYGQDYKIWISTHNLSILIEPMTPEIKEDMIHHGAKTTELMRKINTYFVENKISLEEKIKAAIASQKWERDKAEENQLKELAILRSHL